MTLRDRSRESRHQEWLAQQAYSQFFISPSIVWSRLIVNQPHKCRCGCGEVWYGPGGGTNLLAYLFPIVLLRLLWDERFFYLLFRSVYVFLMAISRLVLEDSLYRWARLYFPVWLSIFWEPIIHHIRSHDWSRVVGRCTLLPVGAAAFTFWASLWFTVFMLAWSLRVLVLPIVFVLYIVSLVLVVSLFILASIFAAIMVIARGLAFVVAGVTSVIYSYHPEIGVVLIVLGLFIEYGFRYHNEKRHRYQLGRIIARQQPSAMAESSRTD